MPYDIKRPAMVSDTMALKATVDPMLIRQIAPVKTVQNPIALSGKASRLFT